MKRFHLAATVVVVLLLLPSVAIAGIAGSDHDLTGVAQDLCMTCHIPHNAQGQRLWSSAPSGTFTGVQDLCYTCHDGSVTSVGSGTAFNAALQQHKNLGSADCSGNGACHDVHDQNPPLTGKFTVAGVTPTGNSYCQTCHDSTPFSGAESLGDHTAGITHFTNGTSFTCNQCHSLHGATPQTTNPAGLTNPILLADNQPGAYYGEFCISCHNGTAPTEAIPGTGGQSATDVFNYAEATNDGTETKHPTTSTTGVWGGVGGCNACHDVHDPLGTASPYILTADNTDSAMCASCHDGAGAPGVGGNSHPVNQVPVNVNMNTGGTYTLPWADQIDDDNNPGPDWATASTNNIVCESCHSVHRNGYSGASAEYFLRAPNGSGNVLCTECHSGKA